MSTALWTGFFTGMSLILAIGAQNAFVLRQGLLREHVLALCLFFAASDALLITAGVAGFDAIAATWPQLPDIMRIGGAVFLIAYGLSRYRAAWLGDYRISGLPDRANLGRTLAIGAAFTWLNPHVYLDTLGLMGAISAGFPGAAAKASFIGGGVAASFAFFFSLGYGARLLAPLLRSAKAWRILDLLIGSAMQVLALSLLLGGG